MFIVAWWNDTVKSGMIGIMKIYITGDQFQGKSGLHRLSQLHSAIAAAGMRSLGVERENEPSLSAAVQRQHWERLYDELGACDSLLVDVTQGVSEAVAIECGMAFALRKPIVVIMKRGSSYDGQLNAMASTTLTYDQYADITRPLKKYDQDRNFTITDKMMFFAVLLVIGGVSAWALAQLFVPFAPIWAVIYWLIVRRLFASMRDFDRIIIYIPLGAVWLGGIALLLPLWPLVAWAWAILFWLAAMIVIQRLKLSL